MPVAVVCQQTIDVEADIEANAEAEAALVVFAAY